MGRPEPRGCAHWGKTRTEGGTGEGHTPRGAAGGRGVSVSQGLSFFCETGGARLLEEVARSSEGGRWEQAELPHPSPSGPRVDRHFRSAWPTLRAGLRPQRPCLPVRPGPQRLPWKWPGCFASTPTWSLTPGTGLSVEEAGGPDRVLTVLRLDARAPGAWSSRPCTGNPGYPRCCWNSRSLWPMGGRGTHEQTPCRRVSGAVGGGGNRAWDSGDEAGRQWLQPEPGHSAGQVGLASDAKLQETGQTRTKRPHCQRHCRQRWTRTRCPRGLTPNDASPLQMGMQAQLPLGENPTSHIVWFLPTSPASLSPVGRRP